MKNFKEGITLLKFNLSSIVLFEIMHKIISTAILAPVVYGILNLSIELAGLNYLHTKTLTTYFASPTTYVCAFVLLMVLAMFFLINICGIIVAIECSKRGEKTNPIALVFKGFFNALRVIHPKNMGIIFYVLCILPVTFSVMISGTIFGVRIPEYLRNFIEINDRIIAIILVIYVAICVFSVVRIFSLNYFTLYKFKFKEAISLSKNLMKRHAIGVFLGVVFINVTLVGIMFLVETVFSMVAAGVLSNIIKTRALSFVIDIVAEVIFFAVYITFSILSTPIIYAFICACFYRYEENCDNQDVMDKREERQEAIEENKNKYDNIKRNRIAYGALIVFGILLNGIYIYLSITDKIDLNIYYSNRALVTAHRGDSYHAPENTMSAIVVAMDNQADIIEIDVRQTSDGELVLMHDESLFRTTGVKKRVGDVDYAFVSTLDAGSKFSKDYKGEHIPTLREAIEFAKENELIYNIELKPEDYYDNYVENVVGLIEEYDYIDQCVLASSDYDALKEVKLLNPDIKTIYIMSVIYGDFKDMEYADGFSVRHIFVNKDLVKTIHKNNKEIYVWTVNSESKVKELLLLDVDSIITDNPYETKEIIYNANESLFTDWLGRLIEEY